MSKIIKGDEVIVLAGRDKGRRGVVITRVTDEKVIVDGINVVNKTVKPNPMKGTTGGVIKKNMAIHQSNLAIFNPTTGKPDRVGYKFASDGKSDVQRKVRVFRSSGEPITVSRVQA